MSFNKTVAILGGDARQVALARYFSELGATVSTFGLPSAASCGARPCADFKEAIGGADLVLLPLPALPDGKHIALPLAREGEALPFSALLAAMDPSMLLIGGKLGTSARDAAAQRGIRVFDYYETEDFQLKNARPTAEGAVSVLMRESPRVILDMPIAITGFGRVARALSELLFAMGATVTVAARNPRDIEAAERLGYRTVLLRDASSLHALAKGFTAIFNTVPHRIFTSEHLSEISKDTLLIELASAPGGFDANEAGQQGLRVIFALSLPGKCSPVTAGEIIGDTVLSYLCGEVTL